MERVITVNKFFAKLDRTISVARFDSYKIQDGSEDAALSKYLWNIALCESLYPVLSLIEVSYRNALHCAVSSTPIGQNWLSSQTPILHQKELEKILEAKENLKKRGRAVTEAFLVSELSFGFWNSLLDSRYDRLWHKIIIQVFPNMPREMRTRIELSLRMSRVRNLRNSALHHHSIWHWGDLESQHAQIYTILGWICESSVALAKQVDRFPDVYRAGPDRFLSLSKLISK